MLKKALFLLFFYGLVLHLSAQNFPGWFTYDTTSSPLPSSLITSLAVDDQNDLWVGTSNGLARFSELLNWTIFNTGNSALSDNWIRKLKFDPQGRLWIATAAGGISVFSNNEFQSYTSQNSPLLSNQINDFAFESGGITWVATEGAGLFRFDGSNWTQFNEANSGFPMNNVKALCLDAAQNLWLGTHEAALLKFSGGTFTQYSPLNSDLPFWSVAALNIDADDNLWIGLASHVNDSCLVKFDQNAFTIFSKPANQEITFTNVWDIYFDSRGRKWISTNDEKNGVILYNDTTFQVFNYGSSGLAANRNYAVVEDADTNVWIATFRGLNILNESNLYLHDEIPEDNLLTFHTYPNPATEILRIELEGSFHNAQLIIKSVDGKVQSQHQIQAELNTIPLQVLVPGLYIAELKADDVIHYKKFIKI